MLDTCTRITDDDLLRKTEIVLKVPYSTFVYLSDEQSVNSREHLPTDMKNTTIRFIQTIRYLENDSFHLRMAYTSRRR